MIKKIAFIGTTGMLGQPVVRQFIESGFEVTALVRNTNKARSILPSSVKLVQGDLRYRQDIDRFLEGQDALYISLSVPQTEKASDWHSETDGMKLILESAVKHQLKRILLLSSLVQRYQGMNNFNWWVFEVKNQSVDLVKRSGLAYTIFYPSTFMESFTGKYMQGNRILMSGKSEFPMFYIAGADYARQVVRSLQLDFRENKEYVIQGPDPLRPEDAAAIFIQNYKKKELTLTMAPFGLLKFLSIFSSTIKYGVHIIEALNRYPEKFESEKAWEELGRPGVTMREFAESL